MYFFHMLYTPWHPCWPHWSAYAQSVGITVDWIDSPWGLGDYEPGGLVLWIFESGAGVRNSRTIRGRENT